MKYLSLWTSLSLVFFFFINTEVYCCDVSVNTDNGQIYVSGLTENDNTKLFDADYNSLWECNPWQGNPCSTNETISGLEVGVTYFLSVVSDICEEWIPITIDPGPVATCSDGIQNQDETGVDCGGTNCPPCSSGCNVSVVNSGNTINVTGMTADVNAKLFDTDFNVMWSCNPWNGNPCTDNVVIPDLAEGNYFFSANSDVCEEWIPITIEGGNGSTTDCQTILEDWDPDCLVVNADGSFTTRAQNSYNTYRENNYSENGELINSVIKDFFRFNLAMSTDGVITVNTGSSSGVTLPSIATSIVATYTSGNNFFIPFIYQLPDNSFYIIGVNVGALIPSTSGFSDAQLDLTLFHLDFNGNEIKSTQFDSFIYENIPGDVSGQLNVRGFIPLPNGGVELYTWRGFTAGPGWFETNRTKRHEISADFSNVETTIEGQSDVNGNSFFLTMPTYNICDLFQITTATIGASNSGISSNSSETQYYDYSVDPRRLVYQTGSYSSNGPGGSFSGEFFNYYFENGTSVDVFISSNSQNDFEVLPDYLIPTSNNTFNYIIDGTLFFDGNDSDNDGICDVYDCQPNNSNLPTTPGEACNDFDQNTVNDRIQADGCTCLGEPLQNACDVNVFFANGGFTIAGLPTDANTKLFDSAGNIVFECNPWSGNSCNDPELTENLIDGEDYYLSVVSEFCQEWIPLSYNCNIQYEEITPGILTITGLENTNHVQIRELGNSSPPNYGVVWNCSPLINNCQQVEEITDLISGRYYTINVTGCDIDEVFQFSPSIGENSAGNHSKVKPISENELLKVNAVFPNPTEHELFLRLETHINQSVNIQVYDAIGKLQFEVNQELEFGNNILALDTNDLNEGIYNLMIIDTKNNVLTERFAKFSN